MVVLTPRSSIAIHSKVSSPFPISLNGSQQSKRTGGSSISDPCSRVTAQASKRAVWSKLCLVLLSILGRSIWCNCQQGTQFAYDATFFSALVTSPLRLLLLLLLRGRIILFLPVVNTDTPRTARASIYLLSAEPAAYSKQTFSNLSGPQSQYGFSRSPPVGSPGKISILADDCPYF